ncbi:MAG: hypothetical protein N4A74_12835 [Carboxylicivirga sp.]|jgi:hypothetical protein|nr:hypothetical protein [Carboxylicivirga sp.]
MKKPIQKLSSLMAVLLIFTLCPAQVKNIKTNVRNDKSSNYSSGIRSTKTYSSGYSSNSSESFGQYLAEGIIGGFVQAIGFTTVEAQKAVLRDRDDYPNTISLEGKLEYGSDLSTISFNPSLRGNWGILASDLRYSLLHDYTGSLESIDWQVLILRVPINNLKLNYGIGFTSLLSPKTTYFESSTGMDLYLMKRKLALGFNYHWTYRRNESRYRQEVKLTSDYVIVDKHRFKLSPLVGISYQNYFEEDEFWMFNIGVKISLSRY